MKTSCRHQLLVPVASTVAFFILFCGDSTWGFASSTSNNKKNKKTKTIGASSSVEKTKKGFGTQQTSDELLNEAVAKFKTRIPVSDDPGQLVCPCNSGLLYKDCCQRFHNGSKRTEQPIDVLRSRYTAFAWRIIPYVIQTTHPTNRDYRTNKVLWAKDLHRSGMFDSYEFIGLEDINIIENAPMDNDNNNNNNNNDDDDVAYIEFKVRLRVKENDGTMIAGQETIISERSKFIRMLETNINDDKTNNGYWLYASGDVKSTIVGWNNTILNR